jgi:class 3 adenylate cyclase
VTAELQKKYMAILFADTHGYSSLTVAQLNTFLVNVLPLLGEVLDKYKPDDQNSWGDGIVAFFSDAKAAVRCALDIRDLFRNSNWTDLQLPNELKIRVALHFGPIFLGADPIRKRDGFVGTQINLAARIEPIVPEESVFATNTFFEILRRDEDPKIQFEALGMVELAKGWGAEPLFHVSRKSEGLGGYKIQTPAVSAVANRRPVERLTTRDQLREPAIGLSWSSVEQRCRTDLLVAGWSCRGVHLGTTRDTFLHLARSGRKVQFLIYDPTVLEKSTLKLGPVCNVGPGFVHSDVRKGLDDVSQLIEMAGGGSENIEVRLTDWFIAWSAVAVDRSSSDGILQIELYHYLNPYKVLNHLDKRVELILDPRSEFYEGFRGSLDTMWDNAEKPQAKK